MKKLTVFVLISFVISFLTLSEADAFFGKKKAEFSQLSGNITGVDLRKSLISVASKDGAVSTVMVDDKTSFERKGQMINLSDLKKGDTVKIDYFVKKGQNRAYEVNVEEISMSKQKSVTASKKKK